MSNEDHDVEEAIAVVLSYCAAMNDWETRRFFRARVDHGYEFTAERDRRLAGPLSAAELDAQYVTIFRQYCTDRKRSRAGFASSYGQPTKYAGISREAILETSRPQPGRIEVSCRCGTTAEYDHKFVVLKRKDRWLIDSLQQRYRGGDWRSDLL